MEKKRTPSRLRTLLSGCFSFGSMDIAFLVFVLLLLGIGLCMMFSASYAYALIMQNDPYYYIKRQIIFAVVGVVAMLAASLFSTNFWKKMTFPLMLLSTGLLLFALVAPSSDDGSFKRSLNLFGFSFQPSEVTKFAVILAGAYIFAQFANRMSTSRPSTHRLGMAVNKKTGINIVRESWFPTWLFCLYFGISAVLVFFGKHLSGCILVLSLGVVVLFLGGVRGRWFVIGSVAVLAVAALMCVYIMQTKDTQSPNVLQEYMADRIINWIEKDQSARDGRWQTTQGLYAIGTGGFFGKGFGNSTQKYMYVPEPQNDMIFSIICEELGWAGAALIIVLFMLLVYRGVIIGLNAGSRFGTILAIGIVCQVGIQMILNVAVATDAIPNTGISLPFFSYGGTSLCMLLGEMGVVLAVSREARNKKK